MPPGLARSSACRPRSRRSALCWCRQSVPSSRRLRCMSRLDFRRSQHLSSLSPVSRWQRDHEGSRRNAIGKFCCGHGLCAGDGGRLGAELTGAQISAHRATAAVDTKARYHRRLRTLVANFRCSRSRPWSGVSDRHSTAPPPFFDDFLYIAVATTDRIIHERGKEFAAYYRGLKKSLCRPLGWKQVASFPLLASYPWLNLFPGAPSTTHSRLFPYRSSATWAGIRRPSTAPGRSGFSSRDWPPFRSEYSSTGWAAASS